MSEDPKGFAAGDYNLFRYCHNDPEDLTDPMGLVEIPPYIPPRAGYEFDGHTRLTMAMNQRADEKAAAQQKAAQQAQVNGRSKDPGVSRETRSQGMKATYRSGEEYERNNQPYGVRVYKLNGKVEYTKPVEGKQNFTGSYTETYAPSPPGRKKEGSNLNI